MLVDLHVHTKLSADSKAEPEHYLEAASRNSRRLDAICFTEHRLFPTDPAIDAMYAELAERFGVRIFKGIEADTDLGHLLLYGVTAALRRRFNLEARMLHAEQLIEMTYGEGGIAIPSHPFRESGYGTRLDTLLSKVGVALGAIEGINGQNSLAQNTSALAAAEKLGLTVVGGSDAHFASNEWFLTCATEFDHEVRTVEELCAELRCGRARPFEFPRASETPD